MTTRDLQNRFGSADRLIDRYVAGAKPSEFTATERAQLREALMRSPVYRDSRSPHHEKLSQDVRDLFLADPGADLKEAGLGVIAGPAGQAPGQVDGQAESLFRS